jgi:hypothetical protein
MLPAFAWSFFVRHGERAQVKPILSFDDRLDSTGFQSLRSPSGQEYSVPGHTQFILYDYRPVCESDENRRESNTTLMLCF